MEFSRWPNSYSPKPGQTSICIAFSFFCFFYLNQNASLDVERPCSSQRIEVIKDKSKRHAGGPEGQSPTRSQATYTLAEDHASRLLHASWTSHFSCPLSLSLSPPLSKPQQNSFSTPALYSAPPALSAVAETLSN